MSWNAKKALVEKRAKLGAEMEALVAVADKETRSLTAEEQEKFSKMEKDYDALNGQIEFFEKRDAQAKNEVRFGRDDLDASDPKAAEKNEARAYDAYLRYGLAGVPDELRSLVPTFNGQLNGEQRAVGVGSLVVGPRQFHSTIVDVLKHFAGVIEAGATVEVTSDGNPYSLLVSNDTGNVGSVLEENADGGTTSEDPTESNVVLNALTYKSDWIRVSNQRLQDSAYDVAAAIEKMAAERIGRKFNLDSTTAASNATTTARGFVAAASVGKTAAAVGALTYGELIDFLESVDEAYQRDPSKVALMGHQQTRALLRKMVDDNNRPIFDFKTNTLLEKYRFVVNNDMAQVGAGAKVLAFGDFSKYVVRVVSNPLIVRAAERFVEYNQTGFIKFQRMDGALADTNAIKVLQMAAS